MNKAITEGVTFQPPAFANGLDVWSSGDGTPGSDTYHNAANAAFVSADQDFGGCLEIQKQTTVTQLRYMGETPILPGCYLQITARVKCLSGIFPSVRVAAWAGGAGGAAVTGIPLTATSVSITTYGTIAEVKAIVGTGARTGVDLPWGTAPLYGHFGIDLTGANGGVVRVDDIEIEDVSNVFLGDRIGMVDVLDYGAVGDGVTDNVAAFEAADAAAAGREVYVPAGIYALTDHMTFENRVRFEGTLTLPDDKQLLLLKNYDLANYEDAFGDRVLAFKKAFQVLMDFSDHESLDLCGRRIRLTEPLDMQAAVNNRTVFASRRVVRNGQFQVDPDASWDTEEVTSLGTYDANDPKALTNVANASNILVGSLVEGVGVGREVYVSEVNASQSSVTLSEPLYAAGGTQVFTFKRFKYIMDFSGFDTLSQFTLDSIEFQCSGISSAIMLAQTGVIFHIKDCFITRPADRGITSPGRGCQGMLIDRCNWNSEDTGLPVEDRTTIGFNSNSNDVKIRDNRIVRFKHFAVIGGTGSVISGNHWFQGDSEVDGIRTAGIVFTRTNVKSLITGNYIDNSYIEWTNEHESDPDFANQLPFGGLTVTGNVFTVNDVAPWFRFLVVKPFGTGFYIHGLSVISNAFKALNGWIDRVDGVDTSFAELNYNSMRNITFEGNTYDGITTEVYNPLRQTHTETSEQVHWSIDLAPRLPFGGKSRFVESLVPLGAITDENDTRITEFPYVLVGQGDGDQVRVTWPHAAKGTITIMARMDRPD